MTIRQIRRAPGFRGGRLLVDRRRTFWTITAWDSDQAMRAFRGAGAHGRAMPRLAAWCDEAAVAPWTVEGIELPDWQTAADQMNNIGRLSPVRRPSPDHLSRQFAAPRLHPLIERVLKPLGI